MINAPQTHAVAATLVASGLAAAGNGQRLLREKNTRVAKKSQATSKRNHGPRNSFAWLVLRMGEQVG